MRRPGLSVRLGANTEKLSLDSYMQAMGVNPFDEGGGEVSYTPTQIDYDDLDIRDGLADSYLNSVSALDSFGQQMAGKGIDVFSPKANHADSLKAHKTYRKLLKRVQQEELALRSSKQYVDLANEARMKKGMHVTGPPDGQLANSQNTRIANIEGLIEDIDFTVKEANDLYSKSFDTPREQQEANRQLEQARVGLKQFRDRLVPIVGKELADAIIAQKQSAIGGALYDDTAAKELLLDQQKADNDNRKTDAYVATQKSMQSKNYAQAAKARRVDEKGGEDDAESVRAREERISMIQAGDTGAVNSLIGKDFMKSSISTAKIKDGILNISLANGKTSIVDLSAKDGGFPQIWEMLNNGKKEYIDIERRGEDGVVDSKYLGPDGSDGKYDEQISSIQKNFKPGDHELKGNKFKIANKNTKYGTGGERHITHWNGKELDTPINLTKDESYDQILELLRSGGDAPASGEFDNF